MEFDADFLKLEELVEKSSYSRDKIEFDDTSLKIECKKVTDGSIYEFCNKILEGIRSRLTVQKARHRFFLDAIKGLFESNEIYKKEICNKSYKWWDCFLKKLAEIPVGDGTISLLNFFLSAARESEKDEKSFKDTFGKSFFPDDDGGADVFLKFPNDISQEDSDLCDFLNRSLSEQIKLVVKEEIKKECLRQGCYKKDYEPTDQFFREYAQKFSQEYGEKFVMHNNDNFEKYLEKRVDEYVGLIFNGENSVAEVCFNSGHIAAQLIDLVIQNNNANKKMLFWTTCGNGYDGRVNDAGCADNIAGIFSADTMAIVRGKLPGAGVSASATSHEFGAVSKLLAFNANRYGQDSVYFATGSNCQSGRYFSGTELPILIKNPFVTGIAWIDTDYKPRDFPNIASKKNQKLFFAYLNSRKKEIKKLVSDKKFKPEEFEFIRLFSKEKGECNLKTVLKETQKSVIISVADIFSDEGIEQSTVSVSEEKTCLPDIDYFEQGLNLLRAEKEKLEKVLRDKQKAIENKKNRKERLNKKFQEQKSGDGVIKKKADIIQDLQKIGKEIVCTNSKIDEMKSTKSRIDKRVKEIEENEREQMNKTEQALNGELQKYGSAAGKPKTSGILEFVNNANNKQRISDIIKKANEQYDRSQKENCDLSKNKNDEQ